MGGRVGVGKDGRLQIADDRSGIATSGLEIQVCKLECGVFVGGWERGREREKEI
jgi:hypothetical protein